MMGGADADTHAARETPRSSGSVAKAKGESRAKAKGERRQRGRKQGVKYFIETYGCQMNVHDSERMAGLLEQSGYDLAESDRDADLVVVNTCSVRERAEEKLYTRLGEIREMAR